MSTKKTKKATAKNNFSTAFKNTKNIAKEVNIFALKTTEDVVSESLNIAGQWQDVTNKAIKGGFKLVATQQDILFDALDTFKKQFTQGKKRFNKIFA